MVILKITDMIFFSKKTTSVNNDNGEARTGLIMSIKNALGFSKPKATDINKALSRLIGRGNIQDKSTELCDRLDSRTNLVYTNRYLLATTVTPVSTAINYIANVIKNFSTVVKIDDKPSKETDSIVSDDVFNRKKLKTLYPNVFLIPYPKNQRSIQQTIDVMIKDYYLNGCYAFLVDKNLESFMAISCGIFNIDCFYKNYNENINKNNVTINYQNEQYIFDKESNYGYKFVNLNNKDKEIYVLQQKQSQLINYYDNCILSEITMPIYLYSLLNERTITKASNNKLEAIVSVTPNVGEAQFTPEQIKQIGEGIKIDSQRLSLMIGNVAVNQLPGGLDGIDIKETINKSEQEIYQAFGLNPALLTAERSAYNNVSQSGVNFINHTALPLADMIYKDISFILRVICKEAENKKAYIEVDRSEIAELEAQKLEKAKVMSQISSVLDNEIRDVLGLPELENGDTKMRQDGLEMKVAKVKNSNTKQDLNDDDEE